MQANNFLYKLATNPWVVVVLFLLSTLQAVQTIFVFAKHIPAMPEIDWIDLLVKAALCGIILILQRTVKQLRHASRMRRIVDGYVHRYRAEVLYKGKWTDATPEGYAKRIEQALSTEADTIAKRILDEHRHLTPNEVKHFLEENYGTAEPV